MFSKLANLPSCTASAALDEVTNPANASSLDVSTLLIKATISANESLSASDDNKIASNKPCWVEADANNSVSLSSADAENTSKEDNLPSMFEPAPTAASKAEVRESAEDE